MHLTKLRRKLQWLRSLRQEQKDRMESLRQEQIDSMERVDAVVKRLNNVTKTKKGAIRLLNKLDPRCGILDCILTINSDFDLFVECDGVDLLCDWISRVGTIDIQLMLQATSKLLEVSLTPITSNFLDNQQRLGTRISNLEVSLQNNS